MKNVQTPAQQCRKNGKPNVESDKGETDFTQHETDFSKSFMMGVSAGTR